MSNTNYVKSVIARHGLKGLMKRHSLQRCEEEEVVQINHFRNDPQWVEITIDGRDAKFIDCEAERDPRVLRSEVMLSRNYFYLEYAGGLRQLWIRNGANFILAANNSF